ncbi:MAG: type II toxin-antitoxin system HicB family antitoxin [Defluviitaleaceae bacterium]|nr:type II toxin-antitoxin system HicB family antitoxin [Defluviitaleaceae bacterium]
MNRYHINVFYSEEDGGFIADTPDLENCSAFGETPQKAIEEMMIAQKLWLDDAKESGREIPPASYKPIIYRAG